MEKQSTTRKTQEKNAFHTHETDLYENNCREQKNY
jgi:hypothetical protein